MTRSLIFLALKLAVIAVAIYYLIFFQRVNFPQLRVSHDGWLWLALAAIIITAQIVLLQFRLFVFLRAAAISIPLGRVIRAGMISWFINAAMLGGLGALSADAVRAGYLVGETKKRTSLFSILFFDRLMGLVSLITLVCAALAAGLLLDGFNDSVGRLSVEIFYVMLCIACALGAVLVLPRLGSTRAIVISACAALLAGLPIYFAFDRPAGLPWVMLAVAVSAVGALATLRFRASTGISSSALKSVQAIVSEAFATFLALRGKTAALIGGYVYSLVAQLMVVLAIFLLGHAIRIEPEPTFLQTLVAAPVAFLTGVLPLPANGIGVGEVAFDAMLVIQQSPGAAPLAGATLYLAFRIMSALTAVVGIPFFLSGRSRKGVD